MDNRIRAFACGLLAASALVAPQVAQAGPASSSVEARLDRMEAELAALRGDLVQSRAEAAAATQRAEAAEARASLAEAQNSATVQRVAALETKPAPAPAPAAPADGFRSGNTTIRLGGYVKLLATSTHYSDGEVATNSLGRDFYLPQTIPTGGQPSAHDTDFPPSSRASG